MRAAFLALVAACLITASLGADTYPRQPGVDAEHYVFRLAIDDTKPSIAGEATVRFRFTSASITSLWLDFSSSNAGKGMTVESVTSGGASVSYKHADNRLTLSLGTAPAPGDRREFTIKYAGVPANGLRLIQNKYNEWSAFSENWPNRAREWLPMIDHPHDKATSEFVVTAPAKYQVVANGLLVEEIDLGDGRRTSHWKQGVPIASWLNAVGIEQFYVHHAGRVRGIELSTWVAHQDKDAGPLYFEEPSRRALEFFSEFVGPYPYEKLANVAAAGIGGGTEHASAIFYGEKGIRPSPNTGLVAHEIAHQWFGNAVTERDWDDVWLSEGFATYFTHLYTEHYAGRDAMVAGLRRDIGTILSAGKAAPDTPVIHRNLSDMSRVLNRFVYQKGGWVLHMLRAQIGTERFREGIREYYRRYMNVNASTADLRAVMQEVSGQDLGWLFTQWLTRPGVPALDGSWRYDAAKKAVVVTITQTITGDPFRLPVEIGVVATPGAVPRVEKVELTAASGTFTITADTEPSAIVLDPNTWLLFEGERGPLKRSGAAGLGSQGQPESPSVTEIYAAVLAQSFHGAQASGFLVKDVTIAMPGMSGTSPGWLAQLRDLPPALRDAASRQPPAAPKALDAAVLPARTRLISDEEIRQVGTGKDGWSAFRQKYGPGWIALSDVLFSADGQDAIVYAMAACGPLCGEGSYFWLRRASPQSRWSVVKRIVRVMA